MIRNSAVIDYRIPSGFSITVGGVDITALVISGRIEKPEFNPSAQSDGDLDIPALLWQGRLVLRQPRANNRGVVGYTAISSIDANDNVNFKAWVAPVVINDGIQQVATLRISKDCRVRADGSAELELRHLALSLIGQAPRIITRFGAFGIQQPYGEDLNLNVRTTADYARNIITNAVNAAGNSVFNSGDIDFSGVSSFFTNTFAFGGGVAVNGFSVEQAGEEDTPIEKANKILFSSYQRCIESRSDERLYLSDEFPLSQGAPIFSLAPQQFRAQPLDYDPDDPEEEGTNATRFRLIVRNVSANKNIPPPSDRVPNPAGVDDVDDPEAWPKVLQVPGINPNTGVPLFVETRTEEEPTEPNEAGTVATRTKTATVVSARFYATRTGTDITPIMRRSELIVETSAINRVPTVLDKKILSRVATNTILLGDANPERFPGDETNVTETITETWEYNTLGAVSEYLKVVQLPRQAVLGASAAGNNTPTVAVREGFKRVLVRQGLLKEYLEVPFKMIPQGQIDSTDTDTLVADPAFDVAENIAIADAVETSPSITEEPASYVLESAESNFESDADNSRTYRIQTVANSRESAQRTADVIGAASQQRRQSWDVEHAISGLYDYRCFRRVNLDNEREAIQAHIVGPGLEFANSSIRLTYTAFKLGNLASRITLPKLPVIPSNFGGALAIAPVSDRTTTASAIIGVPIVPIQLSAFGGTAPYVFTAPALPTGLSIVDDRIVGTPTGATGSVLVTVTVTDNALATDDTTFTLATIAQPVVTPHYLQLTDGQFGIKIEVQARVVVPATIQAAITLPAITHSSQIDGPRIVEAAITLPAITHSAQITSFDVDAAAFISRLSGTYSNAELVGINDFFISLKNNSLYSLIDVLYIHALDTAADGLLNIKGTNFTAVNSGMTFTARQGYQGAALNYLDSTFTPSTAGGSFSLNSAAFGAYMRSNISENGYDIGAQSSGNSSYIAPRWGDGNHYASLNNDPANFTSASSSTSTRLWIASRTTSALMTTYRDAVSQATHTNSSSSLSTVPVWIGRLNGSTNGSTKQIALSFISGGLDATQTSNLTTATTNLLTVFGANV